MHLELLGLKVLLALASVVLQVQLVRWEQLVLVFKELLVRLAQQDLEQQEQAERRELLEVLEPREQLDRERLEQVVFKELPEFKAQLELLDREQQGLQELDHKAQLDRLDCEVLQEQLD